MDRRPLVLFAAALALAGCTGRTAPAPPRPSAASVLAVTSTAFTEGGPIPAAYTCTGGARRPPLAWTGDLRGAKAIAVVVDDPDAPGGDYYHWVMVDLPATVTALGDDVPAPAHQIKNSGGTGSWTAPCPPSGTHHYRFTVYGLSAPTGLPADAALSDAFRAIQRTAVVQGRLTGLVTHQK